MHLGRYNVLQPMRRHQYQIYDHLRVAKTIEHYFVTIMDTKYQFPYPEEQIQ
jgi:hypothetical protein